MRAASPWVTVQDGLASGQDGLAGRSRRRLVDSLEDGAERDPDFARALGELAGGLQAAGAVVVAGGVSASGAGQAVAGPMTVTAEDTRRRRRGGAR